MRRIARLVGFVILGLLAGSGCSEKSDKDPDAEIKKTMGWLDSADPKQMAEQDRLTHKYRFFGVCGFSCESPGVGYWTVGICFRNVPVSNIDGTGDVVIGPEHARLQERAREFAKQYNQFTASTLSKEGLNTCDSSANWDGAMDEIMGLFPSRDGAGYARVTIKPGGAMFAAQLPEQFSLNAVGPQICDALKRNGLEKQADIEVEPKGSDHLASFSCR